MEVFLWDRTEHDRRAWVGGGVEEEAGGEDGAPWTERHPLSVVSFKSETEDESKTEDKTEDESEADSETEDEVETENSAQIGA